MNDELYSYANSFEIARDNSYAAFHRMYKNTNGEIDIQESFSEVLGTYLKEVVSSKLQETTGFLEPVKRLGKSIIEHLTGNYEIGIGDADFEELTRNSETISSIVAYSNKEELTNGLKNPEELGKGIADGVIANSLIESPDIEKAKNSFELSGENIKKFFGNAIYNITHLNKHVANAIGAISGMNREESKGLNENLIGKTIGGLAYEFLSGTLISKRNFTDVRNSESMQKTINEEGILHFTSPENVQKILDSGYIKPSSFLESDLTAKKSFFFAGTPTFEDLLINIPAYDVMTAVRIRPTEEQIDNLKYRGLNDRAVVQDGAFNFDKSQAEVAYFGLMYDKEKDSIYLGEITEEQSKNYEVPEEVKKAYSYNRESGFHPIKNFANMMKMNTYGMYAEYKHHQKLLKMEEVLREKGITSFRDVNDATLVELGDIEQAYISTKDKSVDRHTLFTTIKDKFTHEKSIEESEIGFEKL